MLHNESLTLTEPLTSTSASTLGPVGYTPRSLVYALDERPHHSLDGMTGCVSAQSRGKGICECAQRVSVNDVRFCYRPTINDPRHEVLDMQQCDVALVHTEHLGSFSQCADVRCVENGVLLAQSCSKGIGLDAGFESFEAQKLLAVLVIIEEVNQLPKVDSVEDSVSWYFGPHKVLTIT